MFHGFGFKHCLHHIKSHQANFGVLEKKWKTIFHESPPKCYKITVDAGGFFIYNIRACKILNGIDNNHCAQIYKLFLLLEYLKPEAYMLELINVN